MLTSRTSVVLIRTPTPPYVAEHPYSLTKVYQTVPYTDLRPPEHELPYRPAVQCTGADTDGPNQYRQSSSPWYTKALRPDRYSTCRTPAVQCRITVNCTHSVQSRVQPRSLAA